MKLKLSQDEINKNKKKISFLKKYGSDVHVFNFSNAEKE